MNDATADEEERSRADGTEGSTAGSTIGRLYAAQRQGREGWVLLATALVLGLWFASIHWVGLVLAGALVGISQPTLRRALVAGLGFGVVVLGVAAVQFELADALARSLEMGQLLWVGVAIGLLAPVFGAAVRGLLPDAPGDAARRDSTSE